MGITDGLTKGSLLHSKNRPLKMDLNWFWGKAVRLSAMFLSVYICERKTHYICIFMFFKFYFCILFLLFIYGVLFSFFLSFLNGKVCIYCHMCCAALFHVKSGVAEHMRFSDTLACGPVTKQNYGRVSVHWMIWASLSHYPWPVVVWWELGILAKLLPWQVKAPSLWPMGDSQLIM